MALLYMNLSDTLFKDNESKKQEYLKNALKILEHSQHSLRGKRITFICGDPGEIHCMQSRNICSALFQVNSNLSLFTE